MENSSGSSLVAIYQTTITGKLPNYILTSESYVCVYDVRSFVLLRMSSSAYRKLIIRNISIFTAELRALKLAFNDINLCPENILIIFSDSKSALQAIQDIWTPNPVIQGVLGLHTKI